MREIEVSSVLRHFADFPDPSSRRVAEVDENSSGLLLILTDGTRRVLCFVSFRPGGEDWVLSEFGNIYVSLASPT
ncbi:MAG: hypothetical protein SFU83_04390 [Meiothermus sp.]|nr:hypothetical protein [Meiothermus sp.]